ncbi:MAG: tetratricopeptide repeat protein [Planctomycetota bacterium]|jgi:tetratricopeptide (TPR) repeat protein
MKPVRALVHYLRGVALEADGKVRVALADYEAAARDDDQMWYAFNNAAWHIARLDRTRIETARTYIDRALELKADEPSVHDTAAEVYATLEDFDGALRHVDRALALASGPRAASFMVHKARILVQFDKDDFRSSASICPRKSPSTSRHRRTRRRPRRGAWRRIRGRIRERERRNRAAGRQTASFCCQ